MQFNKFLLSSFACLALLGCGIPDDFDDSDLLIEDDLDEGDTEGSVVIGGEDVVLGPSGSGAIPAHHNNGHNGGGGNGGGGNGGGGGGSGGGSGGGGNGGWTAIIDNDGGNDVAYAVATDSGGNIIVAGRISVAGIRTNAWLAKFDPNGANIWSRSYNAGQGNDYAFAVTVDSADDIILGGRQSASGQGGNVWVQKVNPDGGTVWSQTWNSSYNGNERIYGLAVDGNDNILATGQTWAPGEGYNVLVRKYNSGGSLQWSQTVVGADHGHDVGRAVAADSSGNVIVAGKIASATGGDDMWLRKYSANGAVQWTFTHNNDNGNDYLYGVTVDASNNIYAVGSQSSAGDDDNWVRKFGSAGNTIWTAVSGSSGSDSPRAVAVDGGGEVVFGGRTAGVGHDLIARKYAADGTERWSKFYDGGLDDVAYGVAVAPDDSFVVVVGSTDNASTNNNIIIRRHNNP